MQQFGDAHQRPVGQQAPGLCQQYPVAQPLVHLVPAIELLADPERFVGAVTEKLMMYALGRNVQYYDKPAVREIVRAAQAEDYTFAALVRGIVKSVPFRMRQAPPIEG